MNNWFKKNGTHLAIIGMFVVICFAYFSPAIQGKGLVQGDVLQAQAMQTEIMKYKAIDGKGPLWTNQLFGGMPTYQIWAQYPMNATTYVIAFIKTVLPTPIDTVLLYLLGAYLLFSVMKIKPWLAAAGAVAFAFTTYNFQIIEAGHSNKAMAIAFFAPVLAGILLSLRGRYLMGAVIAAFFMALEIRANHVQMTYYLFIAVIILLAIELYHAIKAGTLKEYTRSMLYIGAAMILSIGVNASMLWSTYEYSKETIRGKSNLKNNQKEPANGLSKDYAYQWSQGMGESFTFLIPNLYGGGGSSATLDDKSEVFKNFTALGVPPEQAIRYAQSMPTYWGEKPFTAGPFYFGAIICFLFVFGLFAVKNRLKWWILGSTILLMLLSFGKNFPLVSDLFFDYFPLYNKFRAVESILAVVGFLVPMLAVLAVKEISEGKFDQKDLLKKLYYSAGITGGFCLLVILMPSLFFDFRAANHVDFVNQLTKGFGDNKTAADSIANGLVADRIGLAKADAIRSLLFVLIGLGITWALIKQKLSAQTAGILLLAAVLFDMWQVDKRYLSNQNFVSKAELARHSEPREVDKVIMADQDPDYRVFDLTSDPFASGLATNFHKTIGGYHAAKLKRFQEVIDKQFDKSINQDVLDMLNTKYIISSSEDGQNANMKRNETACGNAWIVESVKFAKDADEEMTAISSFDPKKEAIVDQQYKGMIDDKVVGVDPNAFIKLESYHPDHLVYQYSSGKDVIAVFSEIYYNKGWKMYIDNVEKPYFRADYLLRAAQLQSGNHKLEFKFEPTSYYLGEKISLVASVLLITALAFAFYTEYKKQKVA